MAPRRNINNSRRQAKNKNVKLNRRRGRKNGRRGRRSGRRGMHYVETASAQIAPGTSIDVTVKSLINRPKSCNFRIRYIHVVCQTGYSESAKAYFPGALQVSLYNSAVGDGSLVATSGPVMLGLNPRNIKVFTPRSSDWLGYNEAETTKLGEISFTCFRKHNTQDIRIEALIHICVDFGPEMLVATCPTLSSLQNLNDPISLDLGKLDLHPTPAIDLDEMEIRTDEDD